MSYFVQGVSYLSRDGFSLNEGGTPFNITIRWDREFRRGWLPFVYVYFFGRRVCLR